MPYGFIGNASQKYLTQVSGALSASQAAQSENTTSRGGQTAPYSPDSAMSGGYATGVGKPTNIVVNYGTYDEFLRKIRLVDEMAAEDLYNIAMQIESMCATIYVVPETLPRYLAILNQVKNSLREFRSITEETGIQTRRFINDMENIDR